MKTFILCSPNRYFMCYRWPSLCQCIDDVNATVKTMREGGDVKLQQHIGGGHYVSVTPGYRCVDIRWFFQPHGTEIKPTKRGVALRLDEWTTLCQHVDDINKTFPSLGSAQHCYYDDDHMNQLGWLNCMECHPFAIDLTAESHELTS